ncbi:MAG: hypothetical protein HS115_05210 [Spirochaetales bacterium]|nr:hypothetical protein [Spirochaetales bacterium]
MTASTETQRPRKKQLWVKLQSYHFDHLVPAHLWDHVSAAFGGPDASSRAFADKLSRKLGWKKDFALRAIHEYKKFVYLGLVSDFVVTPSRIIDQVWHEHLLFSAGYRTFCDEILGRRFDHSPELIPHKNQLAIYEAQFQATLDLYRKEFGYAPPEDIWSASKFKKTKHNYEKPVAKETGGPDLIYESEPLHSFFSGETGALSSGGEFGGAGASGSWDSADASDSDSGSSNDSSSSCSSCSSGCGGCGGGD